MLFRSVPPRKLTAVGTVGEKGQLFTVYAKNWKCPSCSQENYPTKIRCHRCKKKKPDDVNPEYVMDPALQAMQQGETIAWQEAVDTTDSKQLYYYNRLTGQTQWERPVEIEEAPLATGQYTY